MKLKYFLIKGWRPVAVLLLLFIFWEIIAIKYLADDWILPAPSKILTEAFVGWNQFYPDLLATVWISIEGYAIGVAVGLLVAIFLHLLPWVRDAVYPLLILSQNVPIIVLAPLLVIWFGFGLLPKLIVITLVCFFPITVAALDGFRQVPQSYKHYMLMAGATRGQLFWKLERPYALPAIFSGLKISATYSVMGAVISEWLGSEKGIGVYMTLASSSFRTDKVFVAILAIMLLSLLFFLVIIALEKYFIRWNGKGGKVE